MLPEYIQPFFWSYKAEKLDQNKDKKRIITNILNLGSKKAVDWLFSIYSRDDIRRIVADPAPGEWNKKSLNFWSLFFGLKPVFKNKRCIDVL